MVDILALKTVVTAIYTLQSFDRAGVAFWTAGKTFHPVEEVQVYTLGTLHLVLSLTFSKERILAGDAGIRAFLAPP